MRALQRVSLRSIWLREKKKNHGKEHKARMEGTFLIAGAGD